MTCEGAGHAPGPPYIDHEGEVVAGCYFCGQRLPLPSTTDIKRAREEWAEPERSTP